MQPTITTDFHVAADALTGGHLVGLPTETVYGLAALADDDHMVRRVFETKGRPAASPLIVHVADFAMACEWAKDLPECAEQLAAAFWPGPLTMILKTSGRAASATLAGGTTIAIRVPDHTLTRQLITCVGTAIAAPSANRHTRVSPTTAAHVAASFTRDEVAVILDVGACSVGIESAIVDLTGSVPRILRSGSIHTSMIMAAAGLPVDEDIQSLETHQLALQATPAPGQSRVHYAPNARVVLTASIDELIREAAQACRLGRVGVIAPCEQTEIEPTLPTCRILLATHDTDTFAKHLYDALHRADEEGIDIIIACPPASGSAAAGIKDRLTRAAAASK